MEKNIYLKEEKLYAAFKLFDKNNDGVITADELEEVLGSDNDIKGKKEKEFWRNLIKEADLNDDGKVCFPFLFFMISLD
jgi:calcium-dependent protein kinase